MYFWIDCGTTFHKIQQKTSKTKDSCHDFSCRKKFSNTFLVSWYSCTPLVVFLSLCSLYKHQISSPIIILSQKKHHLQCWNAQQKLILIQSIVSYVLKKFRHPLDSKTYYSIAIVWSLHEELSRRSDRTNQKAMKWLITCSLKSFHHIS